MVENGNGIGERLFDLVSENHVIVGGRCGVEDESVEIRERAFGGIDQRVDDGFERVLEHFVHHLDRFVDGLFRKGVELAGDDVGGVVDLVVEIIGEFELGEPIVFCTEGNVGKLGVHPLDLVFNLGDEEFLFLRLH